MKQLAIVFICMIFSGHVYAQVTFVTSGKTIVVSITDQTIYAIENGTLVAQSGAVTGKPDPQHSTPTGAFAVLKKEGFHRFVSPHKKGSVLWYPPSNSYGALLFRASGGKNLYIHDADQWRGCYGISCLRNYLTDGSHGCVNVAGSFARWLLNWADLGTTVKIIAEPMEPLLGAKKIPQNLAQIPTPPSQTETETPKP